MRLILNSIAELKFLMNWVNLFPDERALKRTELMPIEFVLGKFNFVTFLILYSETSLKETSSKAGTSLSWTDFLKKLSQHNLFKTDTSFWFPRKHSTRNLPPQSRHWQRYYLFIYIFPKTDSYSLFDPLYKLLLTIG